MNTARLGNLWAAAQGDTHKMAEALGEELSQSRFASKDDISPLHAEMAELKSDIYKVIAAQTILLVGVMVGLKLFA